MLLLARLIQSTLKRRWTVVCVPSNGMKYSTSGRGWPKPSHNVTEGAQAPPKSKDKFMIFPGVFAFHQTPGVILTKQKPSLHQGQAGPGRQAMGVERQERGRRVYLGLPQKRKLSLCLGHALHAAPSTFCYPSLAPVVAQCPFLGYRP